MRRLTSGTEAVGQGNLAHRLMISGSDEFADLTRNFNDMTARLETTTVSKARLEESDERFRLLIEGVRDHAIFMLHPDGRVASWNTAGERIFGYTDEDIVGQHFSRFYADVEIQRGAPRLALDATTARGWYEHDVRMVRKNGTPCAGKPRLRRVPGLPAQPADGRGRIGPQTFSSVDGDWYHRPPLRFTRNPPDLTSTRFCVYHSYPARGRKGYYAIKYRAGAAIQPGVI